MKPTGLRGKRNFWSVVLENAIAGTLWVAVVILALASGISCVSDHVHP